MSAFAFAPDGSELFFEVVIEGASAIIQGVERLLGAPVMAGDLPTLRFRHP